MRANFAVFPLVFVVNTRRTTNLLLSGFLHPAFVTASKPTRTCTMSTSNNDEVMRVKRLSDKAHLPVRGSEHAAGFDLASAYEVTVPARCQALVKTDLSIAIPPNTYARIAPRSGLALKKMIDVGAGVVDYDYRGPVGVVLFNHGPEDFVVKPGDRVAQLILERICMARVEECDALPDTIRGATGFGSTGVTKRPLGGTSKANEKKGNMEKEPGADHKGARSAFEDVVCQEDV